MPYKERAARSLQPEGISQAEMYGGEAGGIWLVGLDVSERRGVVVGRDETRADRRGVPGETAQEVKGATQHHEMRQTTNKKSPRCSRKRLALLPPYAMMCNSVIVLHRSCGYNIGRSQACNVNTNLAMDDIRSK